MLYNIWPDLADDNVLAVSKISEYDNSATILVKNPYTYDYT